MTPVTSARERVTRLTRNDPPLARPRAQAVRIGEDFFAGVSIMALSFGNQPNVPEIIRELDRPTKTRQVRAPRARPTHPFHARM